MSGKSVGKSFGPEGRVFVDLETDQDTLAGFPSEEPAGASASRVGSLPWQRLDLARHDQDERLDQDEELVDEADWEPVPPPWVSTQSVSSSAALVVLLAGGLVGGLVGWRSATILPLAAVEERAPEPVAVAPAVVPPVTPMATAPTSGHAPAVPVSTAGGAGSKEQDPAYALRQGDARSIEFAGLTAERAPVRAIEPSPIPAAVSDPIVPAAEAIAPVAVPVSPPAEAPAKPPPPAAEEISTPRASPAPVPAVAPRADRVEPDRVNDDAGVRAALGRYQSAYEHLDAAAVKRVWQGVDERALSRAFANLESQSFEFDDCRTTVTSSTAVAQCRGSATYVGRFGSRNSQTQNRQWTFRLHKDGSEWAVEDVQVR